MILTDEQLRTILAALRTQHREMINCRAETSKDWLKAQFTQGRDECAQCIATIQAEIDRRQVALIDREVSCDGTCEPMCKWCNEQADIAAENRYP